MDLRRIGVLQHFAAALGVKFKNLELLDVALTHSSYANEHRDVRCNERLEFLGDAVLDLIVSDYLFHDRNLDEGQLTKLRAHFVREASLAKYAKELHMGDVLLLSRGAEHSGDRLRPAVLADAFEAVLAAVYKDGGMTAASDYILRLMGREIDQVCRDGFIESYKSALQERLQKNGPVDLTYKVVGRKGPDHAPVFTVQVISDGRPLAEGTGHTRQQAEEQAACAALKNFNLSI